jgi:hypothetical protein
METIVTRCRMCSKPMNVPRVISMVFTFDPSVCNQCRSKVPSGMWDTEAEPDFTSPPNRPIRQKDRRTS